MELDKIIVTISGIWLVAFIYWFFFGKKSDLDEADTQTDSQGNISVIVQGGYDPALIKIKKGKATTLKILRKDSNSCLEELIIPGFKVKEYLPLNKEVKIKITPRESGEFGFHCGMSMYHGKIIVE